MQLKAVTPNDTLLMTIQIDMNGNIYRNLLQM